MNNSNNNSGKKVKKKVGRKPVKVEWPDGEFTAKDVEKNFSGKISRVSIHDKIKQAKKNREILFLREDQPDLGRPCAVYKKA